METGADVIVVGGGHAAIEASLACCRMGVSVLMVTSVPKKIASMPCNPSIGGPGKAQIVSEIDALGGEMAIATDRSALEIRMLNASKGPAVQSLRAQVDKSMYANHMKAALASNGVKIIKGVVKEIIAVNGSVEGVRLEDGSIYHGPNVILCTGVYLESKIVIGDRVLESGPMGEPACKGLSDSLRALGLGVRRFKTGTSPRLLKESINLDKLTLEKGLDRPVAFSFVSRPRKWMGGVCYSTFTTEETHEIIRKNLDKAPLFNGTIRGVGPRYCPSIEDKVVRFPHRSRHQIYLEIESREGNQVYILGLSTSLPEEVQLQMVRSVPGLEKAIITRPGYAIEYDCLESSVLKPTLEVSGLQGLFAAGQINGSSGYEEAAAQGLIAGLNAGIRVKGGEPYVPARDEAYIGVLIDDLIGTNIDEPYRMLTSRAEFRLLLRQSNADQRLTPVGRILGLVDDKRWDMFNTRRRFFEKGRQLLSVVIDGMPLAQRLKYPGNYIKNYVDKVPALSGLPENVLVELETEAKYEGFIRRQARQAKRLEKYENKRIPQNMDYASIPGLSRETREKLSRYAPATIGRALKAGISPSDALVILSRLKQGTG